MKYITRSLDYTVTEYLYYNPNTKKIETTLQFSHIPEGGVVVEEHVLREMRLKCRMQVDDFVAHSEILSREVLEDYSEEYEDDSVS